MLHHVTVWRPYELSNSSCSSLPTTLCTCQQNTSPVAVSVLPTVSMGTISTHQILTSARATHPDYNLGIDLLTYSMFLSTLPSMMNHLCLQTSSPAATTAATRYASAF